MKKLTVMLAAVVLTAAALAAGCGGSSDTTSSIATTESGQTVPVGQGAVDSCLADLDSHTAQIPASVQDKVKSLCESLGDASADEVASISQQICVEVATGVAPQITDAQASKACAKQDFFTPQ